MLLLLLPQPPISIDDIAPSKKQTLLNRDFNGFAFAPEFALNPYLEDKKKHTKTIVSLVPFFPELPCLSKCDIEVSGDHGLKVTAAPVAHPSKSWPKTRSRKVAGNLYRHMCNFTAAAWGYAHDGNLLPSPYLDVNVSRDQVKMLNPSPRDVQIGALIDESSGEKAMKKIAKRRIEFMNGNVNSYARVLNGQAQMESIKNYSELAASIAVYSREMTERENQKQGEKKKSDQEKAEKKRQQELKDKHDRDRLLPGCREDVEVRGLVFVLNCNVLRKKDILKHYFDYSKPMSAIKKTEVDLLIAEYFGKMNEAANVSGDAATAVVTEAVAVADVEAASTVVEEAAAMDGTTGEVTLGGETNESISITETGNVMETDTEGGPKRISRKRRRTDKGADYDTTIS